MDVESLPCHALPSSTQSNNHVCTEILFRTVESSYPPDSLQLNCVFLCICVYLLSNLPGHEHKSKSPIWGRLTLCGVFNTLFLQGSRPHSLYTSSKLKIHTRIKRRRHVSVHIHTHSYTHTLVAGWERDKQTGTIKLGHERSPQTSSANRF